jgi:hypothetical protein
MPLVQVVMLWKLCDVRFYFTDLFLRARYATVNAAGGSTGVRNSASKHHSATGTKRYDKMVCLIEPKAREKDCCGRNHDRQAMRAFSQSKAGHASLPECYARGKPGL